MIPVVRAYFVTRANLLSFRETAERYRDLEQMFEAASIQLATQNGPHGEVLLLLAEEAIDETAQWAGTQSLKTLETST